MSTQMPWTDGVLGVCAMLGLALALPPDGWPLALAILVAVVGMPHGGLDHHLGRTVLAGLLTRNWPWVFAATYLAIMTGVLAGWLLWPLATVLIFVVVSAAHFGLCDETGGVPPTSLSRWPMLLAQGGLVVWVPAMAQPEDFTVLLIRVMPLGAWPEGSLFEPSVRLTLLAIIAAVMVRAVIAPTPTRIVMTVMIPALALVPPLVGFAVYFCGWHSTLELSRLARAASPCDPFCGLWRVIAAALPLSSFAVLGIALAAFLMSNRAENLHTTAGALDALLIPTIFIGLSVVAVPHIVLHALAHRAGEPAWPSAACSAMATDCCGVKPEPSGGVAS